ncbi:MAG: hypothetical protein D6723_11720 [Acidobacteria bacterium]|nr:MAG: hypothetical protein D6723_11720 [Acidobacteriota bacterium]
MWRKQTGEGIIRAISVIWGLALMGGVIALGQGSLDYMTEQEADRVREAQRIDWRVRVFMKIAERRLMVVESPELEQSKREEARWGPLPVGSAAEMLDQYRRAIEETIINFEDAYDRNPNDKYILKALTIFRQHIEDHLERLRALRSQITDMATRQALERTLEDVELAYEDARQSEQQFRQERERKEKHKKRGRGRRSKVKGDIPAPLWCREIFRPVGITRNEKSGSSGAALRWGDGVAWRLPVSG